MVSNGFGRDIRLVGAFGAVYLIWGSTYLALRVGVESIPPFLLMGSRSLIAGGLLLAWSALRGAPRPSLAQWRAAAIVGLFLFVGGHGSLAWAEQVVPSGVAALLIATLPIWMTLLPQSRPAGTRPTRRTFLGLLLGLTGVAVLVEPSVLLAGASTDPLRTVVLLLAALSWAIGALYSKRACLPSSTVQSAGLSLVTGGLVLFGLALAGGESISLVTITQRSLLSLVYLIIFGTLIAYASFTWLMRVTSPALVSTYAFVNPVVAVVLGWLLAGEELSLRVVVASFLMVGAVVSILADRPRPSVPAADDSAESPRSTVGLEAKECS